MSNLNRGGARHPLVELTLARLREFVREPEALFWTFVFPIVMSVVMAMAFPSRGDRPVRVSVADGEAAASLRQTLANAPGIALKELPEGGEWRALREGDVLVVVIPTMPPTYRFDPAREDSRTARLVVDGALKRAQGRADPWTAREEPVEVPGSRYIDWLIPGMIAMGIMSNGIWGVGFPIVQARMRKLLKRMVASPMRKREFLLAQLLARLIFLAPEVAVPLAFGVLAFGMPFNGSLGALIVVAVAVAGALAFGAIGLLLGSRPRTFEAVSVRGGVWTHERGHAPDEASHQRAASDASTAGETGQLGASDAADDSSRCHRHFALSVPELKRRLGSAYEHL